MAKKNSSPGQVLIIVLLFFLIVLVVAGALILIFRSGITIKASQPAGKIHPLALELLMKNRLPVEGLPSSS